MKLNNRKLLGGFNRFRLMLTLVVAVILPAAALIYVNFSQLREFERDKVLEAAIHRDFQEMLGITEKKMNKKAYAKVEDARQMFPAPDDDGQVKEKKLDHILAECSCFAHAFLLDEDGMTFRSQPAPDEFVKKEHERLAETFKEWFGSGGVESKGFIESLHNKKQHITFYPTLSKRADGPAYVDTALFVLPDVAKDRVVVGGVSFDPCYLKSNF